MNKKKSGLYKVQKTDTTVVYFINGWCTAANYGIEQISKKSYTQFSEGAGATYEWFSDGSREAGGNLNAFGQWAGLWTLPMLQEKQWESTDTSESWFCWIICWHFPFNSLYFHFFPDEEGTFTLSKFPLNVKQQIFRLELQQVVHWFLYQYIECCWFM